MTSWVDSAIFYHIYPLGLCGCEQFAQKDIQHRILQLTDWIPHLKKLHINALYLGPVFASSEHGYDTSDYRIVDPRLGTNEDFKNVCKAFKEQNIRIVLDGVFNHVGRDFWAFQDVLKQKEQSSYTSWFHLDFSHPSPLQDPFTYEAWEGHYNLVKLNLENEEVVSYLLDSIAMWMDEFQLDGLRLDAADCIRPAFFQRLKQFCKQKNPEFWLMGEIIHGDYNRWANAELLDSVTNYECYKGLYSSHNEKNYFEIGHSLNRQFGAGGIYRNLTLYTFADNHDVNRLASVVKKAEDLRNIYTMLYAMPGIPSLYYGSEYGITGRKHDGSDADIRPALTPASYTDTELTLHLYRLGEIYEQEHAFHEGDYASILIKNEQFVFAREYKKESVYAAFNVADETAEVTFPVKGDVYEDLLQKKRWKSSSQQLTILIPPHDAVLLKQRTAMGCETDQKDMEAPMIQMEHIEETLENQSLQIGRYRHFKGKEYAVLYIAKHSETLEDYVVYRQLYGDESIWVRPAKMFQETVERDGKRQKRFTYIGT